MFLSFIFNLVINNTNNIFNKLTNETLYNIDDNTNNFFLISKHILCYFWKKNLRQKSNFNWLKQKYYNYTLNKKLNEKCIKNLSNIDVPHNFILFKFSRKKIIIFDINSF